MNCIKAELKITHLAQKPIRVRLAETLLFIKETYGFEEDGITLNVRLSCAINGADWADTFPGAASASRRCPSLRPTFFSEFFQGTGERDAATTMVMVRLLARLMDDEHLGKLIVPIVPDEARTFGMDALFRKYGIYSHVGQRYEPVDSHLLLYYRESKDGQILEEGITEAGAMASFTAAGTANVTHGVNTIPFFFFYSMFGFQRIGDSIWAAGDSRCRGFLVGCTSGRTTLAGEGLQHQDGHSLLLASVVPSVVSYDPAFAYEIAVIVRDGIRRMYHDREPIFYYVTVQNEPYVQPPMPKGRRGGRNQGALQVPPPTKSRGETSRSPLRKRRNHPGIPEGPADSRRELRRRRRRLESPPAIRRCAATRSPASGGISCIPPIRRAFPTSATARRRTIPRSRHQRLHEGRP